MTANINSPAGYKFPPAGSSRSQEKAWVKPTLIGIAIGYLALVYLSPRSTFFTKLSERDLSHFFLT